MLPRLQRLCVLIALLAPSLYPWHPCVGPAPREDIQTGLPRLGAQNARQGHGGLYRGAQAVVFASPGRSRRSLEPAGAIPAKRVQMEHTLLGKGQAPTCPVHGALLESLHLQGPPPALSVLPTHSVWHSQGLAQDVLPTLIPSLEPPQVQDVCVVLGTGLCTHLLLC